MQFDHYDPSPEWTARLLPCPFCGRRPNCFTRAACPSEASPTKAISFVSCMCGGHSARAHQAGYSPEEVIAAWNTRWTSPAPSPDDWRTTR